MATRISYISINACQCFIPACWPELFGGTSAAGPGWQPWKRAGERRFVCCMAGLIKRNKISLRLTLKSQRRVPLLGMLPGMERRGKIGWVLKDFLTAAGRECLVLRRVVSMSSNLCQNCWFGERTIFTSCQ